MKLSAENKRALQILRLTTELVEENERLRLIILTVAPPGSANEITIRRAATFEEAESLYGSPNDSPAESAGARKT